MGREDLELLLLLIPLLVDGPCRAEGWLEEDAADTAAAAPPLDVAVAPLSAFFLFFFFLFG